MANIMGSFRKHPDTSQAAKVGEPSLENPEMVSASGVVQQASKVMAAGAGLGGNGKIGVETIGTGSAPTGENAPRSDAPPALDPTPQAEAPAPAATDNATANPPAPDPNAAADPNELKPNVASDNLPAPQQVNQIDPKAPQSAATTNAASGTEEADVSYSSSKHNKKKGLKKVIPF
jgi:hypothetical protein